MGVFLCPSLAFNHRNTMHNREFTFKQDTTPSPALNPSFSSTLLDEIYRSIDVGEDCHGSFKDKCRGNWAQGKALDSGMQGSGQCFFLELDTKHQEFDINHYTTYFSSTSISSDSSYGGSSSSSSDSDSFHGAWTKASCFTPHKLSPVKSHTIPARTEKKGHGCGGSDALFDGDGQEGVVPKSRASKVNETPKKVRQQPVSTGGRLMSILNFIFSSSPNKKKGRSKADLGFERNSKSGQGQGQKSTCSSATSFSRAGLNSSFSSRSVMVSSREDLRDWTGTRSVRFSPPNVIVCEDHPRWPYGRTFQHNEPQHGNEFESCRNRIAGKNLAELKNKLYEERNQFHETKCLEDIIRMNRATAKADDDDGAGSCSSSDLFEIDHLAMIGEDTDRTGNKNQAHAVCKKLGM